jgi:DNA-binding transcriptional LysR family regulator
VDLLAQMTTFVRVAESGSLSRAARRLRLSVPAVSRQLSALERDLGVPLVLRTTRRMALTEAGRRFYEESLRVLRAVEQAAGSVRGGRGIEGRLFATAGVTIGLVCIVPVLPRLTARHPGLTVDLRLEDRTADLIEDGVDVAIRVGGAPPDSPSIIAHGLGSFLRLLVASPEYLRRKGEPREPAALSRHAALLQPQLTRSEGAWHLVRGGAPFSVQVSGPVSSNAPVALRDLAVSGLGIALLPDWLVADDLAAGRLRQVLSECASSPVQVTAIHRVEQRGWPRIRVFLEAAREAFQPV